MLSIPTLTGAQQGSDGAVRAETLHGVVTHIDYATGTLRILAGRGRESTVFTSPGTMIHGTKASEYEELSDIREGAHVTIDASDSGKRIDAVLIKIHDDR